jgi:hypothetical protein
MKPWHSFKKGEEYPLDDVVAECRKYINSRKVNNLKEKRLWIKIIGNSGHSEIVYAPQSERGWGSSPLNANNWKTPGGEPIFKTKLVPKKHVN